MMSMLIGRKIPGDDYTYRRWPKTSPFALWILLPISRLLMLFKRGPTCDDCEARATYKVHLNREMDIKEELLEVLIRTNKAINDMGLKQKFGHTQSYIVEAINKAL